MSGIAYAQFVDAVAATGPQFLSGTRNIINAVSRNSYILGKFLRDKRENKVLQGSNKIQETLFLKDRASTYKNFKRGDQINWQNPQKDVVIEIPWRFAVDHMAFDEVEFMMQVGTAAGPSQLKTKYKDMAFSKWQGTWQSNLNGIEDDLWKPPADDTSETNTFNEMEGDNGGLPYSIPVFIHENQGSNGRFTSAWTTIEGANPATYSNWDNVRVQYDAADPEDSVGDGDGLFDAMDDALLQTGYEPPGFKDEYFEKDNSFGAMRTSNSRLIATSKTGMQQAMRVHRLSNDSLIEKEDGAYPFPRYNQIPIRYIAALDDALLYTDGSTDFVKEGAAGATNTGARYYILDCDNLFTVFHSAKYFKTENKKEPVNTVGQFIVPVQTWWNLICTNRRTQAIVYPGA